MSEPISDELAAFVERVVLQLQKNGYPERRVSFPIEKLYESAYAKGLSFNRVLAILAERGVAHEKTPEKIIFSADEGQPPDPLAGLEASVLAGMSQEQLYAAAEAAISKMSPERVAALRAMVEGMTPEQQAAMVEQARKLGIG